MHEKMEGVIVQKLSNTMQGSTWSKTTVAMAHFLALFADSNLGLISNTL